MATALTHIRCEATSWKGSGPSPMRNRCRFTADHIGPHRDECGNTFDDEGTLLLIRNNNRPTLPKEK